MKHLLALLCLIPVSVLGATNYASPAASNGTGTIGDPWTIRQALSNSISGLQPGDVLYLRGGTYNDGVNASILTDLRGSNGSPITVMSYPGEWAVIDANVNGTGAGGIGSIISVRGSYTTFRDFEILNSYTNRDSVSSRGAGIDVGGNYGGCVGIKVINLIIHDTGATGVSMWTGGTNCLSYGNIVYNTGYEDDPDTRGHGHAFYLQNHTGTQQVWDNVSFNSFDANVQAYSESVGATLNNIDLRGNVSANAGILQMAVAGTNRTANFIFGGTVEPLRDCTFGGNYSYHSALTDMGGGRPSNMHFGDTATNSNIIITNNYTAGGVAIKYSYWTNLVSTNNIALGGSGSTESDVYMVQPFSISGWNVDGNTYQSLDSTPFGWAGVADWNFADWKTGTGFDANSTFGTALPATTYFIRTNDYESLRYHIIVYNWDEDDNVSVDMSNLLPNGASYTLRSCENYWSNTWSGTFGGSTIAIPMTNLTAALPIGRTNAPASVAPTFGTFLLTATAPASGPTTLRVSRYYVR